MNLYHFKTGGWSEKSSAYKNYLDLMKLEAEAVVNAKEPDSDSSSSSDSDSDEE